MTTSAGKQANTPTRVVKVAQAVTPTVYGTATLEDTVGPSLTSPSVTTTAAADIVLSAYAQDQTAVGSFAPSVPTGLELLGQRWANGDVGVALFAEPRANAGTGAHTVTESGGTTSLGAATSALALHAPSGILVRGATATRTGDAAADGGAIVDRPAGVDNGDLLITAIAFNDHSAGLTVTPPSGWTARGILRSSTGGTQTIALYTKVAGASEPGSYTFSVSGGDNTSYQNATLATVYSTVPVSPPVAYAQSTLQDTGGPTLTSPSATTTASSDLVVSGFVQDQNTAGSYAASSPAGLSLLGQQWATSNAVGVALFEETRATAGAGAHTATQNTGSHPARGAAIGIVALHAPSGQLVRRGTAVRNNPASGDGIVTVERPDGTTTGDLIVALAGLDDSNTTSQSPQPDSSWTLLGLRRSTTGAGQPSSSTARSRGQANPPVTPSSAASRLCSALTRRSTRTRRSPPPMPR